MYKLFEDVEVSAKDLKGDWRHLWHYILETEVHVFAFAIGGNVLLSLWPFLMVMISLCRNVLHWSAAEEAIYVAVKDYFAGDTGVFLAYNLKTISGYTYRVEWVSLIMLLFVSNGVFLPLEVALNKAWAVKTNRSLVKNQLVSMGLILACGALTLLTATFTAANLQLLSGVENYHATAFTWIVRLAFKIASIPITIVILFLVYCYLPNTKVSKKHVLPRAIIVGLALESLKWINLLVWPWMYRKFDHEYGVFVHSITIFTWGFVAGLVVLAGAEWTARSVRQAVTTSVLRAPIQDRIGAESEPRS
ncbi:MAG: YihY/virulence factor BrkB family protein [Paludibaculum sp.]